MRSRMKESGRSLLPTIFLRVPIMGTYQGRPVDVQQYVDGSLLVSDDKAGVVYRISYDGS